MTTNSNDYRHALEHISFTDNAKQHGKLDYSVRLPQAMRRPLKATLMARDASRASPAIP